MAFAILCAWGLLCPQLSAKPGTVRAAKNAAAQTQSATVTAAQPPASVAQTAVAAVSAAQGAPPSAAAGGDPIKKAIEQKHALHFVNDLELSYAVVTGPGKAASSFTPGVTYWNAFGVSGEGTVGLMQYTHSFRILLSDDPKRNNGTRFNLSKAAFGVQYKDFAFTGGDFYESYSQYTNRAQLMGGNASYAANKPNVLQVRALFGYAYVRWDEMWRSEDLKVKRRQVSGVNLRQAFSERLNVGLSYLRTDDSQRMLAYDPLNRNHIVSGTYEAQLVAQKITLSGEAAVSRNAENPNAYTARENTQRGMANRVRLAGNFAPHQLSAEYERVGPEFRTFTGAADIDREKVNAVWDVKTSPVTQVTANFLWFQNYLNDPSKRTQTYRPQVGVTTQKILARKANKISGSVAVEQNDKKGAGSLNNIYANLSYGDTLFGFLNSTTNVGVTQLGSYVKKTDTDYTLRQVFDTAHTLSSNLVCKPSLNFGSVYAEDEITSDINKQVDYSLGLVIEMPKSNLSTTFRVGQNRFVSQRVEDSEQFFFNMSVNYRPQSIFGWRTNATIYLRALMNDFGFENQDRAFRESNLTLGVSIPIDAAYGRKTD